ncbi:MAG TPA: peptidoglycan DD-metalloendopeptidase family protein [Bacillales bacterium]|nr:peptidoglycan DD-metalloendopeptidase family protein [Bacillales bacterium]
MANHRKAVVITLGLTLSFTFPGAKLASADDISDLKQQISEVHNSQNEKEEQVAQNQSKLDQVKDRETETREKIERLKQEISEAQNKIDAKKSDIEATRDKIEQLNEEIDATEQRIEKRDRLLKERVRSMYKSGGAISYIDVLLGAKSFGNFLDRVLFVNLIAKQDKRLLEEQIADKRKLEADKKEVQSEMAKLQDQLDSLEQMRAGLEKKKQQQHELMEQLKAQEEEIKEEIEEQQQAIAIIEDKIDDLIAKRNAAIEEKKRREEEQRKRERQQSSGSHSPSGRTLSGGSGEFIVPMRAGTYYISSGYGWRFGGRDFHDGIDFAAPVGTPIYAAGSGTVLYAGPASGFGNWIVIAHPNGYYTVYGHMYDNEIYVHSGEHVSRGQQIAAVGSSGHSTGAHLHFEIDQGSISGDNGVNPYPFF